MAAKKKAKKTLGKKDLKKTKGGLNFAITGNQAMKWPESQVGVKIDASIDPASLQRFK